MTSPAAIPQQDALRLQLSTIAGNEPEGSLLELRLFRNGPKGSEWFPVRECAAAANRIEELAPSTDVYVGAAPRVRRSGTAQDVQRVWCLWVDADTEESVTALRSFKPWPSIVLRSGTGGNLHAWWQLREPLSPAMAVRANRRLALALGADRAATDAARIMRPCGSLNHKHKPPARVECVYLDPRAFTAGEIAGALADDPAYAPRPKVQLPRCIDGEGALAGLVRVVHEALPDTRNVKLNWAAYRAGEHVAAGSLHPAKAEAELLDAATAIGLAEREARRTIASGLTAATGSVAA